MKEGPVLEERLTPALIAELQKNPPPGIRALMKRSTPRALLAIFGNWAAIFACVALDQWLDLVWLTPLFVLLIGTRHYAMAEGICHHAAHHNLFHKKSLHYTLEFLYSWPFAHDVANYREGHNQHHRFFLTDKDVTCQEYEEIGMGPGSAPNLFWCIWVRPLLGYATRHYGLDDFLESKKVIAFWLGMLALSIATGTFWLFLLYHVVPRFYVFSILLYWSDIADHYRTRTGTRTDKGWMWNLLSHNEGYHSIHHVFPGVPWFNIPKAHELTPHPYDEVDGVLDTYRQMKAWKPPGDFPECF